VTKIARVTRAVVSTSRPVGDDRAMLRLARDTSLDLSHYAVKLLQCLVYARLGDWHDSDHTCHAEGGTEIGNGRPRAPCAKQVIN
jgi:hypothetical protein